jgi:tRNA threonylcarbamoyl adenosine modification protein (Sua5/YciO/YrdC/YwlC family)
MIYPAEAEYLDYAVSLLADGEVIVYPTDTLYGFGVDATDTNAIRKVNALKGRSLPLSIVLEDLDHLENYAQIPEEHQELIPKLLPGPYTVLLSKNSTDLSPLVTLDSPKLGIRIPDHPFPRGLVKKLGRPIVTTSINRHGNAPLNTVSEVALDFPDIIIFEDKIIRDSQGSTIVDLTATPPRVVREGDGVFPL